MNGRNLLRLRAHAAGDDDLAVLGHGVADGRERFLLGAVEEPAGVDDDDIGAVMLARELITLRPQARDDALGIHQGLGATERNKADFRRGGLGHGFLNCVMDLRELVLFAQKYKALSWPLACYQYACRMT